MLKQCVIEKIEQTLNYHFKNKNLLEVAFTHSSYAFLNGVENNERLEFLGDSVLNFCTTMYLFNNFNLSEGSSSKTRAYLVSSENVSKYVFDNNLEDFLLCDNFNPHKSVNVAGDLFEAIVGAMFIDGGLECAKNFIYTSLGYSKELIENIMQKTRDYKTELQEIVQKQENVKLEYVLVSKSGPAHLPEFTVRVEINQKTYGEFTAHNKKEAENFAAQQTIEMLKSEN